MLTKFYVTKYQQKERSFTSTSFLLVSKDVGADMDDLCHNCKSWAFLNKQDDADPICRWDFPICLSFDF